MYIKALEQEVLRLKDSFASTTRERDAFAEENRRLKELLMAHGITFDVVSPNNGIGSSTYGGSSSGSISGYGPGTNSSAYTPPPTMPHRGSLGGHETSGLPQQSQQQQQPSGGLDYDQIGIDFVLTYGRTPYLSPPPQQ
jgi:hypothetical protein